MATCPICNFIGTEEEIARHTNLGEPAAEFSTEQEVTYMRRFKAKVVETKIRFWRKGRDPENEHHLRIYRIELDHPVDPYKVYKWVGRDFLKAV